jgi:hypothetical protein
MSKSKKDVLKRTLEDPKYNNQEFKPGTTVTMDSKIFVNFINVNAQNAAMLSQLKKFLREVDQELAHSIAVTDVNTKDMLEIYMDAVDQGLTQTKETPKEDGSVEQTV